MIPQKWCHLARFLILLVITLFSPTSGGVINKIDPELKQKIDSAPTGSTWDVIIGFKKDSNLKGAISASVTNIKDRGEQTYQAIQMMQTRTNESQARVLDLLKKFRESGNPKLEFTSLWIDNSLAIYRAPKELIETLGDDKTPENMNITLIYEDKAIYVIPEPRSEGEPVELLSGRQDGDDPYAPLSLTWGLDKINAPAWWRKTFNGTGVVIGFMDSGADIRHPSLKWNWYGKPYGWLDPGNASNTWPYENHIDSSHGTHALGIAVGRGLGSSNRRESDVKFFGVGVAPGARWISCLPCRKETVNDTRVGYCPTSLLRRCGMWLMCPSGKWPCPHRPNVISVSYGCHQNKTTKCENEFKDEISAVIDQWTDRWIIPVFSAGNTGDHGCQSVANPADLESVISVGSVDENDTLAYDSSMGPPLHEYTLQEITNRSIYKPDFVAPGEKIISTVYTGIQGRFLFDYKRGTSFAAPHMAGAIALLLSRNEDLNITGIRDILVGSRRPNYRLDAGVRKEKCLGLEDYDVNHKFGYGRLQLPDPDDLKYLAVKRPSRKMPPPPDYSDLPDDYDPSQASVHQGMVGLIMIALLIAFNDKL